jgi:hypothetical protein
VPERVVKIANEVTSITADKLRRIDRVASATKILAINALIEASHAGNHGRGFSVVAHEVSSVADEVRQLSETLSAEIAPCVRGLDELGHDLVEQVRGQRLTDLARNIIELIDRNLYERSCDVRWWATDSSVVDACDSADDAHLAARASERLAVILASYTVYLDLWVADVDGRVIAHGRPERYHGVLGTDVSRSSWFRNALSTADGGEFAVDDITPNAALGNAPVATYATAIRRSGAVDGVPIGALGIFFDWGPQAQAIVEGVRLSGEEWQRTRCLLLDANGTVIAASDGRGVLQERVDLHSRPLPATSSPGRSGQISSDAGFYTDGHGAVVGFSLTPGYETYRGLGWYGAIIQQPVTP